MDDLCDSGITLIELPYEGITYKPAGDREGPEGMQSLRNKQQLIF
jgi:hypothetical protein